MKVLIIDDDMMFRKYMKKIITSHYGDELSLEFAVNGAHGLEVMDTFKPSIILTDISMPEMNGLEFIKHVSNQNFDGVIAVLSSYDDFEYVKETLTKGAVDYILKHEAKKEDIFKLIEFCKKKYDIKKEERIKSTQIQNSHDEALQHELLRSCHISGNVNKLIEKFINSRYENLYYRPYFIIITNKKTLEFNNGFTGISIKDEYSKMGGYIHLVWTVKNKSISGYKDNIIKLIKDNKLLNEIIGISSLKYDIEKISEAYNEALDVYFYKLRVFKGTMFFDEFIHEDTKEYNSRLKELCNELNSVLLNRHSQLYIEKFNNFMKDIYISKLKVTSYYTILRDIYYQLLNSINKNDINELEELEILDIKNENILELNNKILNWYKEVIHKLQLGKREMEYSELTNKIIEYINSHIYENIQLYEMAKELGYSDNHLSKQFKNDTGYRIKEYINLVKIEKAKSTIRSGKMKVYEIAQMFSFGSTAYFCSVFKKVTGETVKNYLKKL